MIWAKVTDRIKNGKKKTILAFTFLAILMVLHFGQFCSHLLKLLTDVQLFRNRYSMSTSIFHLHCVMLSKQHVNFGKLLSQMTLV